jgi:hypothetical protein
MDVRRVAAAVEFELCIISHVINNYYLRVFITFCKIH